MADKLDHRNWFYERYASGFAETDTSFDSEGVRRRARAYDYYLRDWLPDQPDAAILDLGCGSGRLLHYLAERGYSIVSGIDISPEQVRLARQVSADVTEGDALPFLRQNPARFDLIVGLDVIEHLTKREAIEFLGACHSALRSAGHIILQTPNGESPWAGQVQHGDFTHEVCLTPHLLQRLLAMSGFSDFSVRETGPVARGYSPSATVRYLLWRAIRLGLKLWNVVETGSPGSGIFTRVFLIRGRKP